jgi:hypothetical protein
MTDAEQIAKARAEYDLVDDQSDRRVFMAEWFLDHAEAILTIAERSLEMRTRIIHGVTDEICAPIFGQSDLWDMTASTGNRETDSAIALTEFRNAVKQVIEAIIQDVHSCHDACEVPMCVMQRENAALREALTDVAKFAETRHHDGIEMGASVWRIALEDIIQDVQTALMNKCRIFRR